MLPIDLDRFICFSIRGSRLTFNDWQYTKTTFAYDFDPNPVFLIPFLLTGLKPAEQTESIKTIHVFVALCDNVHQGIVPVPEKIGNGDDPANNLYWGCGYGVKTFFKKSADWELKSTVTKPETGILERCVFRHRKMSVWMVADAYQGKEIKKAITDFFAAAGGGLSKSVSVGKTNISAGGNSTLLAYVGHDGLMEFNLEKDPVKLDNVKRDAVMLACVTSRFFYEPLQKTGANPLIWTTGLMAPEAYSLDAAIKGWLKNERSGLFGALP